MPLYAVRATWIRLATNSMDISTSSSNLREWDKYLMRAGNGSPGPNVENMLLQPA